MAIVNDELIVCYNFPTSEAGNVSTRNVSMRIGRTTTLLDACVCSEVAMSAVLLPISSSLGACTWRSQFS